MGVGDLSTRRAADGGVRSLLERARAGDRRCLGRLVTMVENGAPEAAALLASLDHGKGAHVIGVTGPPGAGKSTLVDHIVGWYRQSGARVGVVAVDPSSPFSGGAVLGDRIRMQRHFLDPQVFIRSLSARGAMGGLARAARRVVRALEGVGFDPVIVETVGVGQNELDIMRVADTVVVILVPEAGDTVQAMKAGLLEIADVFVVNKADRPGADRLEAEIGAMLEMRPAAPWRVPVMRTVAVRGEGVEPLCRAIAAHREYLQDAGVLRGRRTPRAEFIEALRQEIEDRVLGAIEQGRFADVLREVESGALDPYTAAREVAWHAIALGEPSPGGGAESAKG